MAAAKTGGKKNTENQRVRRLNGKLVRVVLFNGRGAGGPKLYAGEVDGQLILGEDGWPVPYRDIGHLEHV